MKRHPTVLNFSGISDGKVNLFVGQISFLLKADLTFLKYTRRKTFWTLLGLFRSKAAKTMEIELLFDHGHVKTKTDASGAFWCTAAGDGTVWSLQQIVLKNGESVFLLDNLYTLSAQLITHHVVVISDLDDTLLQSNIRTRAKQFRTLMFTAMEKRKTVADMRDLIQRLRDRGAAAFYLSNSEQNLYPLIYRILRHNEFPAGPLFLRQWRTVRDFFIRHKRGTRNAHKLGTLENIFTLFPDKEFILIGDNTQQDLPIYLQTAEKFPGRIKSIVIRKVYDRPSDVELVRAAEWKLSQLNITLHYASTYSSAFTIAF